MYQIYETYGFKIYLDTAESSMMMARSTESYEVAKFKWLKNNLMHDDVFIDVGANKGDFSLLAAKHCKQVVAVEPHPDNESWIRKSIDLNGYNNIDILSACATNVEGPVNLGIGARSGHHSITATRRESISVHGCRLDQVSTFKKSQLVVKIDVEGAEKLVLDGMEGIMSNVRAFLIDIDSGDKPGVMKYLKDFTLAHDAGKEIIAIRGV